MTHKAPVMSARYTGSASHMASARRLMVRGVGSALRASQRPTPLAIAAASGSELVDVDGNRYVDYVLGFGPILLGHTMRPILRSVRDQLARGVLFGAQHRGELELASLVVRLVPGAEMIALSNTGSEAVQTAIRIARAFTGRRLIVKFEGHYHGWIDPVYVNGPGMPPSEGQPPLPVTHAVPGLPAPDGVVVTRWNDLEQLATVLEAYDGVAAVLMEPVPCNFGNYEPLPGYLAGVRGLCDRAGAVLIFDEVISGFRFALGGAQERYRVTPDLTVLAKAIASGFPLSVVAGSERVMSVAADGPVRHIGTYNSNAVSVAAAIATLRELERRAAELYPVLESRSAQLATGLRSAAEAVGAPLVVNQVGSALQLLWDPAQPVRSYVDAYLADPQPVADIAKHLLPEGVHALERGLWFVSAAHSDEDIERTIAAADAAITRTLKERSA